MAIRDCLGARPAGRPNWRLPEGAWDMHFHVLGPQSKFRYSETRKYTPPDAPLEQGLALHGTLGVSRGLVVHANTYGFDNSVDLDAVARSGGRYLAVVRLDKSATKEGCRALHQAGARGVRFAFNPQHSGTLDHGVFDHVMECIEGLGWHVELHFDGSQIPGLRKWMESIPAPVVIDHFGRVDPSPGADPEPFGILCELMKRANFWTKISGADRVTKQGSPYKDVAPLAQKLVSIAPDRIVWGSDWPHTGFFDAAKVPDDGQLVDALQAFVPDPAARARILVDNPRSLLGLI